MLKRFAHAVVNAADPDGPEPIAAHIAAATREACRGSEFPHDQAQSNHSLGSGP
jgi:hypothetical protein